MKLFKKISIVCLMLAVSLCSALFIGKTTAKADGEETPTVSVVIDGASVRVVSPTGIRFQTTVSEKTDGYTYGTLLIPKAILGDNELTAETPKVLDIVAEKWASDTEFYAVLCGAESSDAILDFTEALYNKPIVARSYAKTADGEYIYSAQCERSIAYVASKALADTKKPVSEAQRSFLESVCDSVLGGDSFAFSVAETRVTDKLDLTTLFSATNGNEGMSAVWSVSEEGIVTVDENGIATYVADGTVTVTATIGTKTASVVVNAGLPEVTKAAVLVGLNRTDSVTLADIESTSGVARLTVDGVESETELTVENGSVVIPAANFNVTTSRGKLAAKVTTDAAKYVFDLTLTDFAIGTTEEFDEWYKTKYSSNLSAYVVLTDNISLGWTSAFANDYSGHFEGTFDGCGYTVDGFHTSKFGFIPFLFGTLKNVAFTNVKLTNPGVGFMGHQTGGTVSDVYYQGEQTGPNVAGSQSVGSFYTWTLGNPSVKNLVISVTRVCGADSDAFSRTKYNNIENVYVANNSSIGNTVTTGVNYYASHTEMKNVVAELPAGFGDMWTIDPYVGLTMKSAVGNYSVKWSEETTFMSSISSDTYMSSQAHADMVTEEGTLNGLKVYGIALTDYTANKTFMSWRSLGFSQFNFAVKTSVKQGMLGTAISLDADTWTYLVFKKGSDDKIHCYVSLDKYLGYHEVALGGYTGWCGNTADMIRFGVAGTFNAYFTDIFTVA